jgi:hypothetical protein
VDGHGRLGGDAGHVLTPAGREELADGESPDDDQGQDGGRCRGVPDEAADTDADDGDEADRDGSEEHSLKHAGMSDGHRSVLACEDPLAKLEADDIAQQGHGERDRGRGGGLGR